MQKVFLSLHDQEGSQFWTSWTSLNWMPPGTLKLWRVGEYFIASRCNTHLVATSSNILLNWKSQSSKIQAGQGFAALFSRNSPMGGQYIWSIAHHLKWGGPKPSSQMRKDGFRSSSPPPPSTDLPSSLQLSGYSKKKKMFAFEEGKYIIHYTWNY